MTLESIEGIEEEIKNDYPHLYEFLRNEQEYYESNFGKNCGKCVRFTILQSYLLTKVKK